MTTEEQDDPALYRDTLARCTATDPTERKLVWRVTRTMRAKAARRYLASRHRTMRLGKADGRLSIQTRLLTPALIAGLDVPSDEAEVLLALAPAALVDLLPRLAAQGRERLATDPEAGTPTGRPFRPPEKKAKDPAAESSPAPEPGPDAPKVRP